MPKTRRKERPADVKDRLCELLAELRDLADAATAQREREQAECRRRLEAIMAEVKRMFEAAAPLLTPGDAELLEDYEKVLNDAGAVVLRALKGRAKPKP